MPVVRDDQQPPLFAHNLRRWRRMTFRLRGAELIEVDAHRSRSASNRVGVYWSSSLTP
jgi:hypothetical protein